MTLTSSPLDSSSSNPKPRRKRSGRKRKKSKPSPISENVLLKKVKQLEKQTDTDNESEPDLFLDAQEDQLEPPCTPQNKSVCQADGESETETESGTAQVHDISVPVSDSSSETIVKTVLELNTMEDPASSQVQLSQSLLAGPGMSTHDGGYVSEPVQQQSQQEQYSVGVPPGVPPMSHMSQLPHGIFHQPGAAMFNPGFPVQQYQSVPNIQVGLSDNDIMKIAMQTKQLLPQEIEKIVEEKVKTKTAELSQSVESLKSDNQKLKDSITKLEAKMITKIDDLEQYSRRSCIRIAGIPENGHENTDDHVLELAERLNIDIGPRDIDRSHRVGPIPTEATSIADGDQPTQPRPREIIVKLKSYQARLRLLQARKTLRDNKEKIYINEDLTKTRKSLAFECRKLRRERKVLRTWVYDGNIFLTDRGGTKSKVTCDSELDEYRKLEVPPESEDILFPKKR